MSLFRFGPGPLEAWGAEGAIWLPLQFILGIEKRTHKERDMYNNKVEGIVPCQFLLGMVCKGQVQSLQEIFFKIQKNMLHLL